MGGTVRDGSHGPFGLSPGVARAALSVAAGLAANLVGDLVRAAFPLACASCGADRPEPAGGRPQAVEAGARTGARTGALCDACDRLRADCGEAFCLTCAARGGEPRRCAARERPAPGHLMLRAGFVWNEPTRALVHALKFADAPELAAILAGEAWITPAFARTWHGRPRPDLIVPVPLHRVRRRERGYDQAALLARAFAGLSGAPDVAVLVRARPTRQQAKLGAQDRRANVAGAFRVVRPELVRGRRLALMDDVVTTGATLHAAAQVLAQAGARHVEGWCVAYEPSEGAV